MGDLTVELYGQKIGKLVGKGRDFDFNPDASAVAAFGLDARILSLGIPLVPNPPKSRKARRQNFFAELLPEGQIKSRLANLAGVSEHDTVGLLRAYGRDVAGALRIWDEAAPGEPRSPALLPVSDADVASLLTHSRENPLGNIPHAGKTSLAGVQQKIVLAKVTSNSHNWAQVIDGYPSTHIMKPESRDFPSMIYDEEYGARLAQSLGLANFNTAIMEFAGTPALVIERYDRAADSMSVPLRIHQEDFNQVLGASGDQKYQKMGGKVSFSRIAKELRANSPQQSLEMLAKQLVLAVAIGNLDHHAKNISLIHHKDDSVELAPAYDVVPMAHLPKDGEMAMAVGGEYLHRAITKQHMISELGTWGLRFAQGIIDSTLEEILNFTQAEQPHAKTSPQLLSDISEFTKNLINGKPVGN